ncbi:MAG: VTT domain-containing protein [Anaerolineales bacterium]
MNKSGEGPTWRKWLRFILLVLFGIAAFLFATAHDLTALQEFLRKYEFYGAAACLVAYVLLGPTPIPAEPVTLLVLAWKGPVAAVLIATLGNTLASTMEYYIGGSIGDITDFEKRKQGLPFGLGRLPIQSPVFLLFARMLPGYASKLVSLAGGVYRVPAWTFLWTSVIANLFGAVAVVLIGLGLITLVR